LTSLSDDELSGLIERAVADERGFHGHARVEAAALSRILQIAQGDARRALTALEASVYVAFQKDVEADTVLVTDADVEESLYEAQSRYDRAGDGHYDTISAFIKSVRGSDADAALHYLARMIDGGEDPRFIARRLIILAAEDIGLADPTALSLAVAAGDAVAQIGMPEGRIPLAEATIYLALAPKSNSAYAAINEALGDVRSGMVGPIPAHLRGTGYADATKYGSGVGYVYPHDSSSAIVPQVYIPEVVADRQYYRPKPVGSEAENVGLWKKIREIVRSGLTDGRNKGGKPLK
jgi:putative ATPase